MSEGKYHQTIKEALYEIARNSKKHKDVYKEKKIPIAHPTVSIPTMMYLPEVHIITKYGKKYIFEILDSQGEDCNLIIADIIQAYLVENVSKIFFITKNKRDEEMTYRLSSIIGKILEDRGYGTKYLPLVTVYQIGKSDLDPRKLYKILKKYAKQDNWA